ncbi:MAG: fibrobacter succinogenes major paralogous domain-containing protein [Cryomorphaceae bacterium]|nr:fibrobacter succinogenes major paralogous domain-containing protein [Flavobacteriales bacterium]
MKYRFRLFLTITAALLLFATGCSKDDDSTPGGGEPTNPDQEPLGGSPTAMSLPGNTFDITLGDGLDGLNNISASVTDFENGVSTLNGSVEITNPLATELAVLVADRFPEHVDMEGEIFAAEAEMINTNEGIAFVHPNGEIFNVIKYSANVGDVYTTTYDDITYTRTVTGTSTLGSFFPDETGPDAGLQVIAVEETGHEYPILEKARYYFNEERGLVRAAAHFTNGEVKYIDINSAFLNTLLGDVTIPEAVFNPDTDYGALTDIEGNTYRTVNIGEKTWMAENLRTKRLNDGTAIPEITWSFSDVSGPAWYEFEPERGTYYNGEALVSGTLCPEGWHVPTMEEWKELATAYGNIETTNWPQYDREGFRTDAGYHLASTIDWWEEGAENNTNTSGFSLVPSGVVYGSTGNYTDHKSINWGYDGEGYGIFEFDPSSVFNPASSGEYKPKTEDEISDNGYTCRCVQD